MTFSKDIFLHGRKCTTTLRDCVPTLTNFGALKMQFDWLTDGQIFHLIEKNLGRELKNMELFLRQVFNVKVSHQCCGSRPCFSL
jgi:hypothetical protein